MGKGTRMTKDPWGIR